MSSYSRVRVQYSQPNLKSELKDYKELNLILSENYSIFEQQWSGKTFE